MLDPIYIATIALDALKANDGTIYCIFCRKSGDLLIRASAAHVLAALSYEDAELVLRHLVEHRADADADDDAFAAALGAMENHVVAADAAARLGADGLPEISFADLLGRPFADADRMCVGAHRVERDGNARWPILHRSAGTDGWQIRGYIDGWPGEIKRADAQAALEHEVRAHAAEAAEAAAAEDE